MAEHAAHMPAPDRTRRRFLVPLAFLAFLFPSAIYATVAALHPLLGGSTLAVVSLTLLLLTAFVFLVATPNRDLLDPFRLVSVIFILVYCINPLFMGSLDFYFSADIPTLMGKAAAFALAAFLFFALGYHLPLFRPFPSEPPRFGSAQGGRMLPLYALGLLGFGLLSYIAVFVRAGGVEGIVESQETRVGFTQGFGYLFHASLFTFSGGALYFACYATHRKRGAWRSAWPLGLAFALFLLLQNRSRAFQPLVIFLLIWHYRVHPLRIRRLLPIAAGAMAFFIFVGFARNPDIRPLLLSSPLAVAREAGTQFGELGQDFLGFSLNRMLQLMLAFDCYPHSMPHKWGFTLLSSLNPVLRITGLHELQADSLGTEFFELANPHIEIEKHGGYHPSLLGELLANFPWYLALFGALAYGVALRAFYTALIVKRHDLVSLAVYAAVLFRVVDMVIVGVGQLLFPIAVVALPILAARPFAPRDNTPRMRRSAPPLEKPSLR